MSFPAQQDRLRLYSQRYQVWAEDNGSLVIADFRTDISVSADQLAAYCASWSPSPMIGRITGEGVSELVLIFYRDSGAKVLRRTRG